MKTKNIILLIIRVLTGGIFAYAAYMKLTNMDMTVVGFATMGISETITWVVSIGEALIGLGLIFGVWTRVAAVGAIIIMIGAWHYTSFSWDIGRPLIASIVLLVAGGGCCAFTNCKPKIETETSVPSTTQTV